MQENNDSQIEEVNETLAEGTTETAEKTVENKKHKHSFLFALITWICRLVAGGTFIFSGTVKAIDPWGTVYKLHDYIGAMPDGMFAWAVPLLTIGSFVLFTVELLTGVALVTGSYRRVGAIGGLLMMLVMLPLTLWIAIANPVADCGCFGDAWILSNWATFWKNVVLTILSVWLVIYNKSARCLIIPTLQWLMFAGTIAFAVSIGFIGYSTQPMIDFRPYQTGENLVETDTDSNEEESGNMLSVWKHGDSIITIPADSIPEGDGWEFVERKEATTTPHSDTAKKGKNKGLAIFDGNEEITEDVIEQEGEQVIVFINDMPEVSTGTFYTLNSLYAYCTKHEIPMIAVATATPLQISDFYSHSLAEYPIYTAEDTAIKEVVRGNPAVVYLKAGKIVWKSSLSAIPTLDFLESTPNKEGALAMYAPAFDDETFETLILAYISFLGVVILLSHVPMVIRYTTRRVRRTKWVKEGTVIKVLLPGILIMTLTVSCDKDEPKLPDAKRTVLVYMVATNSLRYDANDDLREILDGYEEASEHYANILVYKTLPTEESPTLSRVEFDKNGNAQYKVLRSYDPAVSSVASSRISEVMADIQRYAPADDYGLFMWSHATGWLPPATPANALAESKNPIRYSYGDDYGKGISITALAEALPEHLFSFIWMDCCYMGGIEVAYELRNHCDTYVAYPTEVLSNGAPYDKIVPILSRKDVSLTEAAAATYRYYADNVDSRYRSCTISVTNMSALADVASVCREMVNKGNADAPNTGIQIYGRHSGITFYDFKQGFSRIGGQNANAAALADCLDRAVTFKRATPYFLSIKIDTANFSGLSCHMLSDPSGAEITDFYKTLDWYRDVYRQ